MNEQIRASQVRLIGPEGEQVGVLSLREALAYAQDSDLDLVEVAPEASPPVCKVLDYAKFKYQASVKAKEARKHQARVIVKEMKLRPKIDPHDYETKKGHVLRFLKAGDKVKVTIMFRGREQSRPELGVRLIERLAADLSSYGVLETRAVHEGRNMTAVFAPVRAPEGPGEGPAGAGSDPVPTSPRAPGGPAASEHGASEHGASEHGASEHGASEQ